MCVTTINDKRGYEFERKHRGSIQKGLEEWGNDVTIL